MDLPLTATRGFSCLCVCVCVGPFQPFGEPSFLRCSGAHGPVPPCVFQMSRGSARCGVIHLPQVQTSPPQNHCQMHSYPARYTLREEHTHTYRSLLISESSLDLHFLHQQYMAAQWTDFFGRDSSWPSQSGLSTQQLSSNEGEVMSVRLRRMVMPNVRLGCYSEPLLSAGLAYFSLHKTRGGDKPKKNLMAFTFEYKSYFTPDVS